MAPYYFVSTSRDRGHGRTAGNAGAREKTDLPHSDLVYHGYILPTSTLIPNPNPPSPPSFLPQPEISLPNPTELSTPIDITENLHKDHTIANQLIGVNIISANTAEEERESYDPGGMFPICLPILFLKNFRILVFMKIQILLQCLNAMLVRYPWRLLM